METGALFHVHQYVKVLATGLTGRVEQCDGNAGRFLVEFNRNPSTRRWFAAPELAGVSSALFFLRLHSNKMFNAAARLIALLPPRLWYSAIFRICVLQASMIRPLIALSPYRKDGRRQVIVAWLLNSWLRQLAALRKPFPIPIRSQGSELILEASAHPSGLVICSAHLPLVHLILTSIVTLQQTLSGVVAGETEMRGGRIPLWGLSEDATGIVSDWSVLLRMRRILGQGGTVFALVDTYLGQTLRPNILRLVQRVEARVVFAFAELMPNGEILVEYFAPPDPICKNDQSIQMNLTALQVRIDRIMRSSSPHWIDPVTRKTGHDPAAPLGSELDC